MNSPFIDHISDCKKRMRKLRKKIYKHNVHQNDKKTSNKNQDLSMILVNIFQRRNLPESLISSLKSKRNIDIFSLKSLVIGNEGELKWDQLTLHSKTSSQEQEVQKLYKEHCQRMQELKKMQTPRFSRRVLTSNYISSTEGDFSSQSDQEISDQNHSSSEFNQNDDAHHDYSPNPQDYENSLQENIFDHVVLQQVKHEAEAQAFSSFEMGQDSVLSGQNIFNF